MYLLLGKWAEGRGFLVSASFQLAQNSPFAKVCVVRKNILQPFSSTKESSSSHTWAYPLHPWLA